MKRIVGVGGWRAGALALVLTGCAADTGRHAAEPIARLEKEHALIDRVRQAAAGEADAVFAGHDLDRDRAGKIVDFLIHFADECHHVKEERFLFPMLREEGMNPTTLDMLISQHGKSRALLDTAEQKLAAGAPDEEVASALRRYASMMKGHILVEDDQAWTLARERLSPRQKTELAEGFRELETEELGEGFHEKYHALAMEILGAE